MGDRFYDLVVFIGRHAFWVSSCPVVLHRERARRDGAFLLASSHTSPYDVAILMRHTPRRLDFVSITELFRKPLVRWFFGSMNAFPHERGRSDPKTVRTILDRLSRGRAVALFPEGRVRPESDSVAHGAPFRPGVARIARMANVPIIPVVVWGSTAYSRPARWLPLRRTRYGVIYGQPIDVRDEAQGERELADAYQRLYTELIHAMSQRAVR